MKTFRHDINGLRAIAVVLVLLFHFDVPGFDGGFLGVDVFFVISGYLMAGILWHQLTSKQTVSVLGALWSFYLARARRILPALIVLLSVVLILGWFVLPPTDYRQLAVHAALSATFLSNIQFFRESGYFDVGSLEKPLLHTWSLSVEWQFYLLLPLLLIAGLRLSKAGSRWATVTAFLGLLLVLSLLTSIVLAPSTPSAAFYLIPTRAWELLAGTLVFLIGERYPRTPQLDYLHWVGLGAISISLVITDRLTPWPGFAAILPVAGTCLVLFAQKTSGWARFRPIRWLGDVSYSLYLWHWPIYIGLFFLNRHEDTTSRILGVALSLAAAALSFHYVETPSKRILSRPSRVGASMILTSAVGLIGLSSVGIYLQGGVSGRMPPLVEEIAAQSRNTNPFRDKCHGRIGDDEFPWCSFGEGEVRAILVGDSHASMLLTSMLDALGETASVSIIAASYTSCPTVFGIELVNQQLRCREFNDFITKQLESLPGVPIIVSNRLSAYIFGDHKPESPTHGVPSILIRETPAGESDSVASIFADRLLSTACQLAAEREVYWIQPIPEMPVDVPRWMARQALISGTVTNVSTPIDSVRERHAFANQVLETAVANCGIRLLDPLPLLCDDSRCSGSLGGVPLYYDEHHLSEIGNKRLTPIFESILRD